MRGPATADAASRSKTRELSSDWSVVYTAEFAKQKNYGKNPNQVDANYYLGELGPGWRGWEFKLGDALLAGRSSTDELTTPLAPPHNGWTDLFFNNPSIPEGSGLEGARAATQQLGLPRKAGVRSRTTGSATIVHAV